MCFFPSWKKGPIQSFGLPIAQHTAEKSSGRGLGSEGCVMRTRHVPQRSCIVCRTKAAKRELVRIVMTPDGSCLVDPTGKRAGRGAYLCHKAGCWERAVSTGRLAQALRGDIRPEDKEQLFEFGRTLSTAAEAPRA